MDYLWSPWRMKYILNKDARPDCVFCTAVEAADGPQNLIVARGKLAFVILNRFPYSSGHLMVVPYTHQSSLELLDAACRAEIMDLVAQSMQVLRKVYSPQGFNVGANIGASAGAGIADHVHMHVVPRWNGDTNFMSVLGSTRVLPEGLDETYERIAAAWNEVR
jgi:ATP adenylyltransferase